MSDAIIERVTRMIAPLVTDLKLDLYDIEFRGGVLRVTLDTPPGSDAGVDIDTLALVTRMISRDFDHDDPMPGHYTLEVTSPGLERTLRTPTHFQREVGKTVAFRLRDMGIGADRRVQGELISATETECVIRVEPQTAPKKSAAPAEPQYRTIAYSQIDRAKTVFVWGAAPKPGKQPAQKPAKQSSRSKSTGSSEPGPHDEIDGDVDDRFDDAADTPVPTSATQEAS